MGNPVVTRLGITQFWYKNWYTNSKLSKICKITHTLEKLLTNYFKYGISYQSNLFFTPFWYKNIHFTKNMININNTKHSLYFRKFFFSHKTLAIEHSYFIRLKTSEYFPLKLYIMRYSNWLITSIQWFKPLKTSLKNNNKISLRNMSFVTKQKSKVTTLRKRILLISLHLNSALKLSKNTLNYKF